MMGKRDRFYEDLARETRFDRLANAGRYTALPADWLLGVADIEGSTRLVAAGRYKTVNLIGAAVISAVMNALPGIRFPFVFGGDGAGFAIAPEAAEAVQQALSAVVRWAQEDFGIVLRAALVPVSGARAEGFDVRVARFAVSEGADYAMFAGGGLHWAETCMKAGAYRIAAAPSGVVPDLTGLSCRWANMTSAQGTILSLVISPAPGASSDAVEQVLSRVIAIAEGLIRGGHPAPADGMEARWAPGSARLEAQVTHGMGPIGPAWRRAALQSLLYWLIYRLRLRIGGFDPRHYARTVAANADFRKLDDGLKMTLDCDPVTLRKLEAVLSEAAARGLIRYGTATQDEAMMTCIVPSPMTDDHLHFIDGAAGGYTKAAAAMKAR